MAKNDAVLGELLHVREQNHDRRTTRAFRYRSPHALDFAFFVLYFGGACRRDSGSSAGLTVNHVINLICVSL